MKDFRLTKEGDIPRLKEMWKLCFGDEESYINYYYENRFRPEETVVLLLDGKIASMLTMIPVWLVLSHGERLKGAMLYAIATHPDDQGKGLAGELIAYANQYLNAKNAIFSVLVPAEKSLFDYYRGQGYKEGFYVREMQITKKQLERLLDMQSLSCKLSPVDADTYNKTRDAYCRGKNYLAYETEEFAYQKKISRLTGADLLRVELPNEQGCMMVERIDEDKVMMKELLVHEDALPSVLLETARTFPANVYIFRTPAFLGSSLDESAVRPFAMLRMLSDEKKINVNDLYLQAEERDLEASGYLGLAFD